MEAAELDQYFRAFTMVWLGAKVLGLVPGTVGFFSVHSK